MKLVIKNGTVLLSGDGLPIAFEGASPPEGCCCDESCPPIDCSSLPSELNFVVESTCPFYDGWTGTADLDSGCSFWRFAGEQGGACDFPDYIAFEVLLDSACCADSTLNTTGECGVEFLGDTPGLYTPTSCSTGPLEVVFEFDFIMQGSDNPLSCQCCENGTTFTFRITIFE